MTVTSDSNNWWEQAFTPEEKARMESRFNEIVSEETATHIQIAVSIPREVFNETLEQLGETDGFPSGNEAVDALIAAMCLEYMENEMLEPSLGCTILYGEVFGGEDE